MSNSNESSAEKVASEESQSNEIDSHENATSTSVTGSGVESVQNNEKSYAEVTSKQKLSGVVRPKLKSWFRPCAKFSVPSNTKYSEAILNPLEFTPTELPQYGTKSKKKSEYKRHVKISKPAVAQNTSLPNKQDTPRTNISTTKAISNKEEEVQKDLASSHKAFISKKSDISDNLPALPQADKNILPNTTGAIMKIKKDIDFQTEQKPLNSEERSKASDGKDGTDNVSSINTTVLPNLENPYYLTDNTLQTCSNDEQILDGQNWEEQILEEQILEEQNLEGQILEDENLEADDLKNPFKSVSAGTLCGEPSSSGIYSGVTSARSIDDIPLDEEYSTISAYSSQSSNVERISHYSITFHNKVRCMKHLLAEQAFKSLTVCDVIIPLELRRPHGRRARIRVDKESLNLARRNNSMNNNNQAQRKIDPDRDFFQSIPSDQSHNVTDSLPRPHAGVAAIERMENILEMLLSVGYKISKETRDAFGSQQVPTPIHNAMSDVKTFLEPLKAHIESSVQDEYLRPLIDSVNEAVTPIYHHLHDSIVALESPATSLNYVALKLDERESNPPSQAISESDELIIDTVEEIYEMATYDRSIMNQAMHTFSHSSGFRAPFHRPGYNSAHVVPLGLIEIPFRHNIVVLLTLDLGILVVNKSEKIVAAISADGYLAGFKFRFGECLQTGSLVDASFYNAFGEIEKRAKISAKGITFQDECSPSTYVITPASITTCQRIYSNLTNDFVGRVFYSGSRYGPQYIADCVELLNYSKNTYDEDGSVTWLIQNIKIKQNPDGQIILHRDSAEYTIIITPNRVEGLDEWTHTARLTTPEMHITCSATTRDRGNTHHMYIRQEPMKIFCSDQKFIVRNYTQSAGIDNNHKIYLNAS